MRRDLHRRRPSASGRLTSTSENGWHPLSHNQKSLWFLHQVAPESTAYNISFAARIRGELDTEALRRAFDSVVSRHASLRTSFAPAKMNRYNACISRWNSASR
jgi:hypothetical protein